MLENVLTAFHYIYVAMPVWLPAIFLILLFKAWLYYRRADYWNNKLGSLLLEIRLPRIIDKSPLAMEVILNQIHQPPDESNAYWKYWRGQTRSWFSLEIVSFGGDIHFYVWTRKKYKVGIEAHFYSQYPGVEIYEVDDYTKNFYFDPEKQQMSACQWELAEPDPYPIATYVDYGLDKDPKEEYKVDPMSSMLEFFGSLPQGHNLWAQIIVRAHKKEQKKILPWSKAGNPKAKTKWTEWAWSEQTDAWKDEANSEIKRIREESTSKYVDETGKERPGFPNPTKGQQEKIAALERSIGKPGFDTTIRTMYFADKDKYDGIYLGGMLGAFKQFGSIGYNGFKNAGWHLAFKGAWYDWWKTDKGKLAVMVMEEYKLRRFFFSPYIGKWFYSKPFILNSEELATVFHLPGATTATPTLQRVPSKKSEAPSNLPI